MTLRKFILSVVFPYGLLAVLLAGCAAADRAERQSDPAVRADVEDDDRDDANGNDDRKSTDDHRATTARSPRGSAGDSSAVTAPPSLAELPNLKPPERTLAARIEVEGSQETTKRPVVPAFKEIELTAEEKKALGKDHERPDDILAFYKPTREADHGVSTFDSPNRFGISGRGGALVGTSSSSPRAYAFGEGGRHAQIAVGPRSTAGVDQQVPVRFMVGPPWLMQIGWGPARTGASHKPYLDP